MPVEERLLQARQAASSTKLCANSVNDLCEHARREVYFNLIPSIRYFSVTCCARGTISYNTDTYARSHGAVC